MKDSLVHGNWRETNEIVDQMIGGSNGKLWGTTLETSSHYPVLRGALDHIGNSGSLLDVGCGAGDVSRIWKGQYTGVDLDWVIEKVSRVCNPNASYISTKIDADSVKNLPPSRSVLMNAFLDVREDPHEIFEAFLQTDCEFIVVHRQRLAQDSFKIEYRESYGDAVVPASVMSANLINEAISRFSPNAIIATHHWQLDYYSFIVRKS